MTGEAGYALGAKWVNIFCMLSSPPLCIDLREYFLGLHIAGSRCTRARLVVEVVCFTLLPASHARFDVECDMRFWWR
jgi:hypothetical protein